MSTDRPSSSGGLSVVMVTPGWPVSAFANGIVSYTAAMRLALGGEGAQVRLLASRVRGELEDGIEALDLEHGEGLGKWLRKITVRINPDWSLARNMGASIGARLSALAKHHELDIVQIPDSFGWSRYVQPASPVPVVVRLHGPWFLNGVIDGARQDGKFRRRVGREGQAIVDADAISAPSASVLESTRKYYSLELPGAKVIPNPVEPVPAEKRWRLDHSAPGRILFVGRFDRHKGADVMIEAFAQLAGRYPQARLVMVGPLRQLVDDDGRKWEIKEFLQAKVPEAAVRQRIEVLGQQPLAAVMELRRQAFVTVVSSRYETFGNVAAEAMNLGCPVVASHTGGLAEIVEDQKTGLLFKPGDAGALAGQLRHLLDHPARAAELGGAGAESCWRRYRPQEIARQTLEFYQQVIERRPSGADEGEARGRFT